MFICKNRGVKAGCQFLIGSQKSAPIRRQCDPFNGGISGMLRFISGINEWDSELTRETLKKIENHWKNKIPEKKFDVNKPQEKLYILSMFPYPSGNLHMGHIRVYGTADVLARYFRMKNKNVFLPMGWDAFGLPAENAALERQKNPDEWTQNNIVSMKTVMEDLNFSFDWDREFATCDPEYYKWTQFFFLKLFERGLIYRQEEFVNWDPVDQTVLADEQVDLNGCSWRSGALVEKKLLQQWFIKTTAFAKSLSEGLKSPLLKGWGGVIDIQKNWIGEVNGTIIDFEIVDKVDGIGRSKIPIWMKNPEYIDKAKFVALKRHGYWTFGFNEESLLPFKVKNPFTSEILPVYQTDSVLYAEGVEIHLGIPEINKQDREFADSVNIRYDLKSMDLAREEELANLREEICAEARKLGIGGYPASSKLKDWLISRQRFWGTPIPIVYCKKCGVQPVPEEDLPVRLPRITSVKKGTNSLAANSDWVNTTCPKCGGEATRETDTMDTFVDSCWYYLRFTDPDNEVAAFDVDKVKNLMPVDIYIGGKEHATLHLFYARFMNHFLHSLGVVPHQEPFIRLLCQGVIKGMTYKSEKTGEYVSRDSVKKKDGKVFHAKTNEVLIEDWKKMSKSKNNSVEPRTLIAKYGADLTRILVLGASSSTSEFKWNENLSEDVFRWKRRLWLTVGNFIKLRNLNSNMPEETETFKKLDYYIFDSRNYYLMKVTSLIEGSYDIGTAIRKLQGLTGSLRKCSDDVVAHSLHFERALAVQIILLAPIAPYFSSELWSGFTKASNRLCNTGEILWDESVFSQPWPQVDPHYTSVDKTVSGESAVDFVKRSSQENSPLDKIQSIKMNRKVRQKKMQIEKNQNRNKVKDSGC